MIFIVLLKTLNWFLKDFIDSVVRFSLENYKFKKKIKILVWLIQPNRLRMNYVKLNLK